MPFLIAGWNLWNGRPTPVFAAGPGRVIANRNDAIFGPVIEIDHGSGLRTCHALRRYGSSDVVLGLTVAAGSRIGALASGYPDDLSYLQFAILLDTGGGELLSLDPSPFMFRDPANRRPALASSSLNAAVWAGDRSQLISLLALGLNPNRPAVDGSLPLEWTMMTQDAELTSALVAAGADPRARTAVNLGTVVEGLGQTIAGSGPRILQYAREGENPSLIEALARR